VNARLLKLVDVGGCTESGCAPGLSAEQFGLARVRADAAGATMARLTEAESAVLRAGTPDVQIDYTGDELTTARAYRAAAEFIPGIGRLVDVVHRHHLIGTRTHFERVVRDSAGTVVCGVRFADLSGFTALTQTPTQAELSTMLNEFIAAVSDVVHAADGRVVKFIGDEVMWVSSTPELLATAADELVHHPKAREAKMFVQAGLGYGDALAINGDYFGNMVNLAARLVAAAKPGQILASQAVRDELPDWAAVAQNPLTLKGFDAPITAYELRGRR
jgi:class 3 adenylate cyclase